MYFGFFLNWTLEIKSGNLYMDIFANCPGNFQKISDKIYFSDSGFYIRLKLDCPKLNKSFSQNS